MKKFYAAIVVILIVVLSVSFGTVLYVTSNQISAQNKKAQQYTYKIIHAYPHDTTAFTEGLIYADGYLYESKGLYGESTLRQVNLTSGAVLKETALGKQYFGEGITKVKDTIVQLTWQEHTGFVYDKTSFEQLKNFTYSTEGWGLTFDGKSLIMSDGTDSLYFLDPVTFQRTGQIHIYDGSQPIININELEYINGDIYANIFQQQKIAIINPQTGQVKGWIDLTGIENVSDFNSEMVLNGIAFDAQNNRLFVTGKLWPQLFEIRLVPQN
jgi:glutaminyl-peptide cyclotransferase